MQISSKPQEIGYSWPAKGLMNIAFFESGGSGGNVLEVQVDQHQAHNIIRQLTEFCQQEGHPLYVKGA